MGVWQGVAMDSLEFHLGPSCSKPCRQPCLKQPFQGWPPTGWAACGRPPFWPTLEKPNNWSRDGSLYRFFPVFFDNVHVNNLTIVTVRLLFL
jgi:hypothetical protein